MLKTKSKDSPIFSLNLFYSTITVIEKEITNSWSSKIIIHLSYLVIKSSILFLFRTKLFSLLCKLHSFIVKLVISGRTITNMINKEKFNYLIFI